LLSGERLGPIAARGFPALTNQDIGFGKLDYQFNAKITCRLPSNLELQAPNSYRTGITQANESPSVNGTARTREQISSSTRYTSLPSD